MHKAWTKIVVVLAGLLSTSGGFAAERAWSAYVSGFAGVSLPRPFDIRHQDPSFAEIGLFEGIDAETGLEVGGDVGFWRLGAGGQDWGVRFQVTHSRPDVKAQEIHGFGVSGGEPFDLDFTSPATDIEVTTFAVDLLARLRTGSDGDRPEGRFNVYGGLGVGGSHTSQTTPEFDVSGSSTNRLFELVGGAEVNPWPRIGVFGEYRYTWSEQTLEPEDLTFRESNDFEASHLVAGVRLRL